MHCIVSLCDCDHCFRARARMRCVCLRVRLRVCGKCLMQWCVRVKRVCMTSRPQTAFLAHYNGNRAPFGLWTHAVFATPSNINTFMAWAVTHANTCVCVCGGGGYRMCACSHARACTSGIVGECVCLCACDESGACRVGGMAMVVATVCVCVCMCVCGGGGRGGHRRFSTGTSSRRGSSLTGCAHLLTLPASQPSSRPPARVGAWGFLM